MAKLLLVRHAERPDIPANTVGNEVCLTEKGKADTRNFAQSISGPVVSIHSSPIGRCRQTAEIIAEVVGFNSKNIVSNRDLGDPGFIIDDGSEAWVHWQEKGHQLVNEHLLSGSEHWEGFKQLDQAVKEFDCKIQEQLSLQSNGIHVWVTHDTILATYISRVMPNQLSLSQWPQYLDFIAIELKNGDVDYNYTRGGITS